MPLESWLRPGPCLGAIPTSPEQGGQGWAEEGSACWGRSWCAFAHGVALLGQQKGCCPRCHLLGEAFAVTLVVTLS